MVISVGLVLTACGQTTTSITPTMMPSITAQPTHVMPGGMMMSNSAMPSMMPSATMGQMKQYQVANVPFSFSYPASWVINQDATTSVSISSPESAHLRTTPAAESDGCIACRPEMTISYYADIAEEPGNKLGKLGATSLDDLFKKDQSLKVVGTTTIAGYPAFKVVQSGFGDVYMMYIKYGKGVYQITFNQRSSESELTMTEKAILASLKLTSSTSTAPAVGSSMMKTAQ